MLLKLLFHNFSYRDFPKKLTVMKTKNIFLINAPKNPKISYQKERKKDEITKGSQSWQIPHDY